MYQPLRSIGFHQNKAARWYCRLHFIEGNSAWNCGQRGSTTRALQSGAEISTDGASEGTLQASAIIVSDLVFVAICAVMASRAGRVGALVILKNSRRRRRRNFFVRSSWPSSLCERFEEPLWSHVLSQDSQGMRSSAFPRSFRLYLCLCRTFPSCLVEELGVRDGVVGPARLSGRLCPVSEPHGAGPPVLCASWSSPCSRLVVVQVCVPRWGAWPSAPFDCGCSRK